MARWESPDGVGIDYEEAGQGPGVLLLHGFASSARVNWVRPGIVAALAAAGLRAVAYDARGHGSSGAPHDVAFYSGHAMVADARGLADHLGFETFAVVGYSMGAQVAAWVVAEDARVRRAVLGGIGSRLLLARPGERPYPAEEIARALEADRPPPDSGPTPLAFRAFADATGADRLALAALQRARAVEGAPDLALLSVPVLVVAGEDDTLVGDPAALAEALPDGRLLRVPGDHLSAVLQPAFVTAVVDFLRTDPPS
ncbi:MAG: alpha/beta hydrolase [Acidobacteriota bacterium]|nr:alpha/beta hydrolase [Acidobacteriota bacterium]